MREIMKTIERIAILCAVLLPLFSCRETPVDPVEPVPEAPQPESRTLTFVLPEFTLGEGVEAPDAVKTAWKAGDQIVVHGEYAKDQVVVTLGAGDISGDGKSATVKVDGLYPYQREDCSSTLYASYPAAVVDNLKHCFFYSKFSTTNTQLLAACNSGDTFQFQNICGILSMTVDGNLGGYTISTPKKDAIGYEFLQVKITDQEQIYKQFVGDPLLEMDGTVNGNNILVFLPEGTTFPAGFVIKFKEGNDYTKIFKYNHPVEIARGAIVDLGDITDEVQHYDNPFSSDIKDLDANGNANCYIVTEPGGYKFKAVKGNSPISFLDEPDAAEVIWETWNDVSEVVAGSVVASASYAEDYIILHTPDVLHPGNAIIAAKNAEGRILWSWHIWIPKTAVTSGSYGGIMGEDIMDRNLGALVVTEASDAGIDPLSYGLMYQWGRKDPFTGSGVLNENTLATWVGMDDVEAPGLISLEDAIANPRLLGHSNSGDWIDIEDSSLWSETEKTIYDPCPPGYRVPKPLVAPFWGADLTVEAGWGVNVTAGWLKLGSPEAAVFPIAGYRDDYTVAGISKVGSRTLYWTSRGSGITASNANLRTDSGYKFGTAGKSRLGSVRCTVE